MDIDEYELLWQAIQKGTIRCTVIVPHLLRGLTDVSPKKLALFLTDPDRYWAESLRVDIGLYYRWLAWDGWVRCTGAKRNGKRCGIGYDVLAYTTEMGPSEFEELENAGGWRCHHHTAQFDFPPFDV